MPQKSQRLKKAKRLKKSSQKWLLRQINDPFVERAKLEGWRSRAAFKIIEVDEKFKIFKKGKIVVDLGAAPGGWSQYAVTKVGEGNVIAIDLLPIDSLPGVNFFVGDFMEPEAPEKIISLLKTIPYNKSGRCDAVLSDMAANTTGDHTTDHMRIIALLEEALILAEKILKEKGAFVGKIFQGGSSDEILKKLRKNFSTVKYFKPNSSRKDSSETYVVALGFKKTEALDNIAA
ncbi:MAG: RlmE family RNA methyltransferase [Proteobacteria bacterium]|nr:RlmE family RNA methyltransferase [Pseudomonadota bacterium]